MGERPVPRPRSSPGKVDPPRVPAHSLLTGTDLSAWAGERLAAAGRKEALLGRVEMLRLAADGLAIEARVRGNRPLPYRVKVWVEDEGLRTLCTCAKETMPVVQARRRRPRGAALSSSPCAAGPRRRPPQEPGGARGPGQGSDRPAWREPARLSRSGRGRTDADPRGTGRSGFRRGSRGPPPEGPPRTGGGEPASFRRGPAEILRRSEVREETAGGDASRPQGSRWKLRL